MTYKWQAWLLTKAIKIRIRIDMWRHGDTNQLEWAKRRIGS